MSFLFGGDEFYDALEDLVPGENPIINAVGNALTPGDGKNPLSDWLTGEAAGRERERDRKNAPPAEGGGGCPLDCYQTCQAKNQKIDEQAKLSIDNFYKTMKERGVTITGCKVRPTGKVCGMRRARAKPKACASKRRVVYKSRPKPRKCGC
jgi:hypothetical protein